jgi:hypothetical protein
MAKRILHARMKKRNKLVFGYANPWLTSFYSVLTAAIKNKLITGKGLAIGGEKYILKPALFQNHSSTIKPQTLP